MSRIIFLMYKTCLKKTSNNQSKTKFISYLNLLKKKKNRKNRGKLNKMFFFISCIIHCRSGFLHAINKYMSFMFNLIHILLFSFTLVNVNFNYLLWIDINLKFRHH